MNTCRNSTDITMEFNEDQTKLHRQIELPDGFTKMCTICGEEKGKDGFHHDINRVDGLSVHCIECKRMYDKKYYCKHKELKLNQTREYYQNNKEHVLEYQKNTVIKIETK